jgi:hypothetical protein
MSRKAKLSCDVLSAKYESKGVPKVYGKKGEEVELISNYGGNVWIVENKKKDRYPVNVLELIIQQ